MARREGVGQFGQFEAKGNYFDSLFPRVHSVKMRKRKKEGRRRRTFGKFLVTMKRDDFQENERRT